MLTLILALVLQDGPAAKVRELSKSLEGPSAREVYRAVEALAGLGDAALPALDELARDAKPRVRAYLELAAAEIRSGAPPAPARMSIQRTNASALTLLEEIQRKTGYPMMLRELASEEKLPEIPVDVKDATLLEAVDAVCRAGNVMFYQEDGLPMFYAGDYEDYPKFFYGHYMFLLESATYQKSVDFRKPATETYSLSLGLLWDHRIEPTSMPPVPEVLEAVDDKGNSLLLPADLPKKEPGETVIRSFNLDSTQMAEEIEIKPPGLDVEKISRLRGRVKLIFPKKASRLVFEKPAVGAKKSVDGFDVEVTDFQAENGYVQVKIVSAARKPEEIEKLPLMANLEISGSGKVRGQASSSVEDGALHADVYASTGGATFQIEDGGQRRVKREVRVLELRIVTETVERWIPFEFRDVKIK